MTHSQPPTAYQRLKTAFIKHATFALFFILPQRLTSTFVGLCLLSLIYQLREEKLEEDAHRLNKINRILKIHVNEDILVLPRKTLSWYWGADVINERVTTIKGRELTIREILVDNAVLTRNRSTVINHLLANLPTALRVKLNLSQPCNRIRIKHALIDVLLTQPAV